MQKLTLYKKQIVCVCAAAAVIAVAAVALLFNKKEEVFRSILVYDVQGSAVIERESVGTMNAAENLYLESGDRVSVASDSSMRMKLDDDKYVMAEADTAFSLEAEGTEADSKTKICLEQGAITNEIQHPLSEGAQYETSTPNSVMAVRGTIYRVELYVDENGDQNTKLCCFQGKVGTKPVLPDGTYGEETLVPAGSELTVYQDGTVSDVEDIAYDELPRQAVINLLDMMENGQDMTGISLEELTRLASPMEDPGKAAENEDVQALQIEDESAEQAEEEIPGEADAQIDTDMAKNITDKPSKAQPQAPVIQPTAGKPAPQAPAMKPPKTERPVNSGRVDHGNTGGEGSQDENTGNNPDDGKSDKDKPSKPNKPSKPDKPDKPGKPDEPGKPDKPDEPDEPDKPDKPDEPDEPDKPGKPDEPGKPEEPSDPVTYTVTFMYQGRVFATQTVTDGETAAMPVLVPDQSGTWEFDFGTKIEANTTISWK